MAAYAAVADLKRRMEIGKTYIGMAIGPLYLEIVEKLIKELSWIEESIERMDVRRRMKMKASLQQIPELIEEYNAVFDEHGIGMEEDLKQHTYSFLERLKKMVDGRPILSRPEMVGLSDEFSKLKVKLVGDWEELPFFSLVGKTALAKKFFKDLDILEWFDCCAWVTVGRNYRPEEIIQTILAQVDLHAHETPTEGFQEMVECLKESLEDKRYLIIFDDVWDIQLAQDYLKFLFPNNGNKSRVLLTTRIKHESDDDPFSYHHLRLLNKEESWHLLREKVFDEGTCPPELEEAGKKIAEKCDGLPLTIITVADLLSKAEKTESFWNEVVAQKRHQVFMDAYDEISKVLDFAIFPRAEFDLPIFCANFFSTAVMNIVVLDLNPLHDVISRHDYKKKYYKHLIPLGLKYAELLPWGGKITTESMKFFSPIVIWTKFPSNEQKHHLLYSAFNDYLKSWLKLMDEASGEIDVSQIMVNLEAQHRYLTWRAEKDPGHQVLRRLVGETLAKEIIRSYLFNGVNELNSKTFVDYFPEYKCDNGTTNPRRSMIGKSFETRPWDTRGEFIGNGLR